MTCPSASSATIVEPWKYSPLSSLRYLMPNTAASVRASTSEATATVQRSSSPRTWTSSRNFAGVSRAGSKPLRTNVESRHVDPPRARSRSRYRKACGAVPRGLRERAGCCGMDEMLGAKCVGFTNRAGTRFEDSFFMTATTYHPARPLAELKAQHDALRDMMDRCEQLADAVDSGQCGPTQLTREVARLRLAFEAHNTFEEQLLRPVLQARDAFATARIDRMIDDHVGEHRMMRQQL